MKLSTFVFAGIVLSMTTQLYADELPLGSVAIYSNGQVKKLVQNGPDWTLWESARKRLYKESYLPYLPTLEYRRFPAERGGYTRRVVSGDAAQLVPFGDQQSVTFTIDRMKSDGSSDQRRWRCNYEGTGQESLMETNWAVQLFSCSRFGSSSGGAVKLKEQREISYAPELGIVVKEILSRPRKGTKVTRLQYLLSPQEASYQRIADLVKTLRN
ncbi:hypothetical protein GCM10011352_33540 [Marinobacterium zhoushanense]|uniref:Uncharacterized protein n=1 Tax=Marinobacterium zhoushanense TaxID=1679163 RepID=A0ABQ1KS38_9GAMM|nr:hypothetical protein [Marinobacterium zhoushanense]GGC04632.1 hypothetical protein GCM10011352_33540 [Marinobacterium zhoushanense]